MSAGVRPAPQGAPHPLWSQFLKEATCNDTDLQRYLKQRAGYWLTGDTSLEDFDFFYGPGGNGKGVFLKTIATIMGDYALVAPISQFMVSRHDEHLCELARLAHARLVIASEPEENRTWAIGKIKQLTGNEGRIAARHMHQRFFEFLPRFKLVFVGNTKPRIASVDEALVRRLNLVPFRFQPATRDEQLKEKLVVEYPAILRWAIDGWLDLQANGRVRPAVIAERDQGISRRRKRDRSLACRAVRAWPAARDHAQGAVRRLENLVRGQRRRPGNQQEAQAPAGKAAGAAFRTRNARRRRQRHRAETMRHDAMTEMTLRAGLFPMPARRETKAANCVISVIPSARACDTAPAGRRQPRRKGTEQ